MQDFFTNTNNIAYNDIKNSFYKELAILNTLKRKAIEPISEIILYGNILGINVNQIWKSHCQVYS